METMTQNTLADLRSMEHAAEDKKDRYLLGLCTLFVATMEDAKDRISQLELVFCSQLFPAFQAKLLESRQALHQAEILHQQALQDLESTREDLLRDMQNLRADTGKETMRMKISSEIHQLHQLHQELQELLQEKQLRADEASHYKLQLDEQAILHKRLSSELDELQQELLRLRKEKDLQEQKNLCRNPQQKEEPALLKSLASNEPLQRDSLQIEFEKLSEEAAELRQSNIKLLQENQDIHQHCSKLSSELGLLKSKVLSSSSKTPPTVAETDVLDIKSLQLKLEQKSQERSLECFRRQLISTEVEKEKKATHAALVKLHTLKKRYQSLRKQYTVLFRHSHLLEHQKQAAHATICENQEKFDLGDAAVERYSNTNVGELKAKCNCAKARTYTDIPSSSKVKDSPKYAPNLALEGEPSHVSVMDADNHARQVSKEAELTNTLMLQKEVIKEAVMESPGSSNASQSPDGSEKRENDEVDKEDRVLDTPPKLNHSENNLEKFLQPQKSLLPVKSCDHEIDCIIVSHLDKASQVGHCSSSFLKADLNFGANVDEITERTESSNYGDNILDSSRSLESPLPSEDVQGNMKEGPGAQRPADNGWCPVQKRAFSSKCHPKASKSLKTTWRNTRSRAEVNDFDPHDDFLNTPHENALRNHTVQAMNDNQGMIALHQSGAGAKISEGKGILKPRCKQEQLVDCERKVVSLSQITTQAPDQEANFTYCANQNEKHTQEQVGHSGSKNDLLRLPKKHGPCAQHLEGDSRNKDSISAMSKRKVVPVSKQGPMYKYVEPVRKKDEREKLQGVECNQCKKFYDAVLLNNGAGATSARCEHHDVTSRHRYRYMPPLTPEGFWNIGFDSEL